MGAATRALPSLVAVGERAEGELLEIVLGTGVSLQLRKGRQRVGFSPISRAPEAALDEEKELFLQP